MRPEDNLQQHLEPTRRERVGWYFYDWANSAFSATVVTVFLGPYLTTVTKAAADASGFVYPLGIKVSAGSFFPYVVSLSVLLQVVLLPILGALADYSQRKKQMLAFSAYLGSFATMGLYYLDGTNYLFGGLLFLAANTCFGASMVFYNAFLSEIAAPEERDSVSSVGWAMGYMGDGILLGLNLLLVFKAEALGLTTSQAVRICLASAGVWWAVFTLVPLATLRTRRPVREMPRGEGYFTVGFKQLFHTMGQARGYPQTLLFLGAFLLYNDGIQTVISMSSQFGQEELGLSISTLIVVILMVQFVAFFGSLLFNLIARLAGAKRGIVISLIIWVGALVFAYGFLKTTAHFFFLGAVIALVLGGSQALSRSVYSQIIPHGQEAEYFSLYEISQSGTSWLGPLFFGLALQFTGSYRVALLSLAVFFILGLILLISVNLKKAVQDVGGPPA